MRRRDTRSVSPLCLLLILTGGPNAGAQETPREEALGAYVTGMNRLYALRPQTFQSIGAMDIPTPHDIVASPDGRFLAASHSSNAVAIVDTGAMKVVATLKSGPRVARAAFSPGGAEVWVSEGQAVRVHGTGADRKELARVALEGAVYHLAFTPQGRHALVGTDDAVYVVDATTRAVVGKARTRRGVRALAVAPDGR